MSTENFTHEVVDKLKKQGLFDQFRKDCLADVDTKPAYQNLQMKVTGAVERYLSGLRWKPDLNKNHIRERLRRHLTELPMLSMGIDRVVDQVINPKIFKDFKPKIDKVVCEHMNINYDEWSKQQEGISKRPFYNKSSEQSINKPTSLIPSLLDFPFMKPEKINSFGGQNNFKSYEKPKHDNSEYFSNNSLLYEKPKLDNSEYPFNNSVLNSNQVPIRQNLNSFPPILDAENSQPNLFQKNAHYASNQNLMSYPISSQPFFNVNVPLPDVPLPPENPPLPPLPPSPSENVSYPSVLWEKQNTKPFNEMDLKNNGNCNSNSQSLDSIFHKPTDIKTEDTDFQNKIEKNEDNIVSVAPTDVTLSFSRDFNFAWKSYDVNNLSDISVSSVHTSDLSSFEDDEDSECIQGTTTIENNEKEEVEFNTNSIIGDKVTQSKEDGLVENEGKSQKTPENLNNSLKRKEDKLIVSCYKIDSFIKKNAELIKNQKQFQISKKQELKEELKVKLKERKVEEKKREICRQRTLNPKYASEDYTSIFSEKKNLLPSLIKQTSITTLEDKRTTVPKDISFEVSKNNLEKIEFPKVKTSTDIPKSFRDRKNKIDNVYINNENDSANYKIEKRDTLFKTTVLSVNEAELNINSNMGDIFSSKINEKSAARLKDIDVIINIIQVEPKSEELIELKKNTAIQRQLDAINSLMGNCSNDKKVTNDQNNTKLDIKIIENKNNLSCSNKTKASDLIENGNFNLNIDKFLVRLTSKQIASEKQINTLENQIIEFDQLSLSNDLNKFEDIMVNKRISPDKNLNIESNKNSILNIIENAQCTNLLETEIKRSINCNSWSENNINIDNNIKDSNSLRIKNTKSVKLDEYETKDLEEANKSKNISNYKENEEECYKNLSLSEVSSDEQNKDDVSSDSVVVLDIQMPEKIDKKRKRKSSKHIEQKDTYLSNDSEDDENEKKRIKKSYSHQKSCDQSLLSQESNTNQNKELHLEDSSKDDLYHSKKKDNSSCSIGTDESVHSDDCTEAKEKKWNRTKDQDLDSDGLANSKSPRSSGKRVKIKRKKNKKKKKDDLEEINFGEAAKHSKNRQSSVPAKQTFPWIIVRNALNTKTGYPYAVPSPQSQKPNFKPHIRSRHHNSDADIYNALTGIDPQHEISSPYHNVISSKSNGSLRVGFKIPKSVSNNDLNKITNSNSDGSLLTSSSYEKDEFSHAPRGYARGLNEYRQQCDDPGYNNFGYLSKEQSYHLKPLKYHSLNIVENSDHIDRLSTSGSRLHHRSHHHHNKVSSSYIENIEGINKSNLIVGGYSKGEYTSEYSNLTMMNQEDYQKKTRAGHKKIEFETGPIAKRIRK